MSRVGVKLGSGGLLQYNNFFFWPKYTLWKMSEIIFDLSAHSSASYLHTCLISVLGTVQLLMINITFWFLLLKWQKFLIILFWKSSKLI